MSIRIFLAVFACSLLSKSQAHGADSLHRLLEIKSTRNITIRDWVDAVARGDVLKESDANDSIDKPSVLTLAKFKSLFPEATPNSSFNSGIWRNRILDSKLECWTAPVYDRELLKNPGYEPPRVPAISSWLINCVFDKTTKKMVNFWICFRAWGGKE